MPQPPTRLSPSNCLSQLLGDNLVGGWGMDKAVSSWLVDRLTGLDVLMSDLESWCQPGQSPGRGWVRHCRLRELVRESKQLGHGCKWGRRCWRQQKGTKPKI